MLAKSAVAALAKKHASAAPEQEAAITPATTALGQLTRVRPNHTKSLACRIVVA